MSSKNQFKVPFIGTTNVGKTTILNYMKTGQFIESAQPTTSIATHLISGESGSGEKITIAFWDTAGQERFKGLGPMYYQNAAGCVAVFDITSPETFKAMKSYIDTFKEICPESKSILVLANKMDLVQDPPLAEYIEWCNQNDYTFYPTTAKLGTGIQEALQYLFDSMAPEPATDEDIVTDSVEIETKVEKGEAKGGCC